MLSFLDKKEKIDNNAVVTGEIKLRWQTVADWDVSQWCTVGEDESRRFHPRSTPRFHRASRHEEIGQ